MQSREISGILEDVSSFSTEEKKRLFELMLESRRESEKTKREIKKYNSVKDVMIQQIAGKYKFYEFFFSRLFDERAEAIQKDIEIIDRGIKENDKELVNAGVTGLSKVAASNPFADMEIIMKKIENL